MDLLVGLLLVAHQEALSLVQKLAFLAVVLYPVESLNNYICTNH